MKNQTLLTLLAVIAIVLLVSGLAIEYTPTETRIGYAIALVGLLYAIAVGVVASASFFEREVRHAS